MKKCYKIISISLFLLFFTGITTKAQYTSKRVRSKFETYTDSLKNVQYNYVFPFLGQGAYKKGFDIPYPFGIMTNYFWGIQSIVINNMHLGLTNAHDGIIGDIPLTNVDKWIGFGKNTSVVNSFNVRPDIWVLPFLNVYGIFGYGHSHTVVNLVKPIELESVVDQNVSTSGFGVLGAAGLGPVWISVDANFTWNKPVLLDKPTKVNILGLRVGHVFVFKNHPYRNISIWVGAMRLHMSSETVGAIKLKDALPQDVWDRKDEIVQNYDNWYAGLSPAQQALVDKTALPKIRDAIDEKDGESIIHYGMDKQTKQLWNGLVGVQFQLNKRWQFRSEGGIIGDRKSFLFSVNYRFLGFKKKPQL